MQVNLYHASPEILTEINDDGMFGGIFASKSKQNALSHHEKLHIITLEESEILTQQYLNYEADYETVKKAIVDNTTAMTDEELEIIYDVIIENKSVHDSEISEKRILEILRSEDLSYASWETQRIRGIIAKELGFKAVEMNDEHGLSYLVLSNTQIKFI